MTPDKGTRPNEQDGVSASEKVTESASPASAEPPIGDLGGSDAVHDWPVGHNEGAQPDESLRYLAEVIADNVFGRPEFAPDRMRVTWVNKMIALLKEHGPYAFHAWPAAHNEASGEPAPILVCENCLKGECNGEPSCTNVDCRCETCHGFPHRYAPGSQAERLDAAMSRLAKGDDPTKPLSGRVEAGEPLWRVGTKVPLNIYEGNRPVCQCHHEQDALRIVAAVNARAEARTQQHGTRNSGPWRSDEPREKK